MYAYPGHQVTGTPCRWQWCDELDRLRLSNIMIVEQLVICHRDSEADSGWQVASRRQVRSPAGYR